jgi:putative heme iron utilization protein
MQLTPKFSATDTVKKLLREGRQAALATLMPSSGDPYCSLIEIASAADGSPILLISGLAIHTKNIRADARISIMIDERKETDPLQGARVMLSGTAVATDDEDIRRRYVARLPHAADFAGFHDFGFYKMNVTNAHLVAGFGRITDRKPEQILTKVDDASSLMEAEAYIVKHLNENRAGLWALLATKILGAADGEWRCVGCDPEGVELQKGQTALRLTLPKRVRTPGALRTALRKLAAEARAKA